MSGRVHPGKPEPLWELLYWFWGSQASVGVTQALQREHSAGFLKQRYRWINQFLEKSEGPRSRRSSCCPCMPRQSEEQSRWVSCPWFGTNMWVFLGIPNFLNLGIFCSMLYPAQEDSATGLEARSCLFVSGGILDLALNPHESDSALVLGSEKISRHQWEPEESAADCLIRPFLPSSAPHLQGHK